MADRRTVVMTFKVEPELADALRELPNTSEFIRSAVRDRLGHVCPLCNGAGALTEIQRLAADKLLSRHEVVACTRCGRTEFSPCHGLTEHVHDEPCADPWLHFLEQAEHFVCRGCFHEAAGG